MPLYPRTSDDPRHPRAGPIRIDCEQEAHPARVPVPYPFGHVEKHIVLFTRDPIPWFHYNNDAGNLLLFPSMSEPGIWNAGQWD